MEMRKDRSAACRLAQQRERGQMCWVLTNANRLLSPPRPAHCHLLVQSIAASIDSWPLARMGWLMEVC